MAKKMAKVLTVMVRQVLGRRLLPLVLSPTPLRVATNRTRLNFRAKNVILFLARNSKIQSFPLLIDSATDVIISKCWNREYHSVKDLLAEFADGTELDDLAIEDHEWLELRQAECKAFIKSGCIDTLERY